MRHRPGHGVHRRAAAAGPRRLAHRHRCRPTFRYRRGTRCSSRVTPTAPRTTSACRRAPASHGHSSGRRPRCSTTTTGKSSTHFLSPNPIEKDTPRATWQHSRDTSAAWGEAIASAPSSSRFVPAIPWLLLESSESRTDQPVAALTATTFIQRLNTVGRVAPSTGCTCLKTSATGCSCRTRPTTSSTGRPAATTTTTKRFRHKGHEGHEGCDRGHQPVDGSARAAGRPR